MNKKQYDVENHGEERKHKFTMAVWRKITEVTKTVVREK